MQKMAGTRASCTKNRAHKTRIDPVLELNTLSNENADRYAPTQTWQPHFFSPPERFPFTFLRPCLPSGPFSALFALFFFWQFLQKSKIPWSFLCESIRDYEKYQIFMALLFSAVKMTFWGRSRRRVFYK